MKNFNKISVLVLSIALFAASCSKESKKQGITEKEAAQVIEAAIADSYAGFSYQTQDAVTAFAPLMNNCDTLVNFKFNRVSPRGKMVEYDYDFQYMKKFLCDNDGNLRGIHSLLTLSGNFDSPGLSASGNTVSDWTITGFGWSSSSYTFSGNFHRDGSYEVYRKDKSVSFQGALDFASNNIEVRKFIGEILGGSASIHLEGSTSSGKSFNYDAAITFHGDGEATLVINGNSHPLKWR